MKNVKSSKGKDSEKIIKKKEQSKSPDHSMRMVEVDSPKPHPSNEKIYGKVEPSKEFLEAIREDGGITAPLILNGNDEIVSGHHRWKAAIKLGYTTVPVIVRNFETKQEELKTLIFSNCQRSITEVQKLRSYEVQLEAERFEAKERQKNPVLDNCPEAKKGNARDIAAKPFGRAGKTMESGLNALHIAEQELEGKEKAEVIGLLEQGKYDPAAKRAKSLIEVKSAEKVSSDYDFFESEDNRDEEGIQIACLEALKDAVNATSEVAFEAMPAKRQAKCRQEIIALSQWMTGKEEGETEE